MAERFLCLRCLHGGPLSAGTLHDWSSADRSIPWKTLRACNLPLLAKLTATYGACAMLAQEGPQVVGVLRFYPKVIAVLKEAGDLCLQQEHPAGPSKNLAEVRFPSLEEIGDRTLVVHCLMTGSPSQEQNPYQRRGLGSRLVRHLVEWAAGRGWRRIEATTYEDLPMRLKLSGITRPRSTVDRGLAGRGGPI